MKKKLRIRVLIVSANQIYDDGAINRLVDYYSTELNKRPEFEVRILAELYTTVTKKRKLYDNNIICYKARPGRLRNASIVINILHKLLFGKKPDIIHLQQIGIELLPLFIYSKIFRSKLVITNQSSTFKGKYRGNQVNYNVPYDIISKLIYINKKNYIKHYSETNFICVNKELVEYLASLGFSKNRLQHIPNGVDVNETNNNDIIPEKFIIIWAGRYHIQKNITLLFEVASILKDAKINFIINLFGFTENDLDEYDKILYQKISDCVFIKGYTNDLTSEIKKSHIGLFTSLFEEMSIAMLEMLSCGVPVITTPVSGMKEVIEENDCGTVCKSNNANEIANEIINLIANRDKYLKQSHNANKVIRERYNIEENINKHIMFYKRLVNYLD